MTLYCFKFFSCHFTSGSVCPLSLSWVKECWCSFPHLWSRGRKRISTTYPVVHPSSWGIMDLYGCIPRRDNKKRKLAASTPVWRYWCRRAHKHQSGEKHWETPALIIFKYNHKWAVLNWGCFCACVLSLSSQPVSLSDREVISRLRNCLLALAAHKVLLYDTSVLYCYESSLQHQVGITRCSLHLRLHS